MKKISKLLALETTDVSGSVALCEDGQIITRRFLCPERRSAQSLAPAIQSLLRDYDWKPTDVDVVAVASGPGSFTGLRVGVATGKMFAWAVNARIIGVDSLDAIVATIIRSDSFNPEEPTILSVGIDAQRGDAAIRRYLIVSRPDRKGLAALAFDGRFRVVAIEKWLGTDGEVPFLNSLSEESHPEVEHILSQLSSEQIAVLRTIKAKDAYFAGPALRRVKELSTKYPSVRLIAEEQWNPDAAGVALVAWENAVAGAFDDVWKILPKYSRRAAAEEKFLAKQRVLDNGQKTDSEV